MLRVELKKERELSGKIYDAMFWKSKKPKLDNILGSLNLKTKD